MKIARPVVKTTTPVELTMEEPTPPEIEANFPDDEDERILRSRRSLQLSIGIDLINVIKLVAMVLNMSFSLIIREIIRPYLNVGIKILKDEGILNEYGNVIESLETTKKRLKNSERIVLVRRFVDECNKRELDTSWIDKTSL